MSKTYLPTQLSFTEHFNCSMWQTRDTTSHTTDICLSSTELQLHNTVSTRNYLQWIKTYAWHFSFHERNTWRKILTASLKTSLFIGKMCSIRTKGKREERISLSSSMSRSRLFTPLLFTLWAVPLSKFGSTRQKWKVSNQIQMFWDRFALFSSTYTNSTTL